MWLKFNDVWINGANIDYIFFEHKEDDQTFVATVYFQSGDSLTFEDSDLNKLKGYFIGVIDDKRTEVG